MTATGRYQPLIGLEVHAQLLTESKMFCGCSAHYFTAAPNTHTCAVCTGMPGSLPVISRKAVEYTVRTALALQCSVAADSKFDRKNYSYPDIPKGYQISQYNLPIGRNGRLDFRSREESFACGIIRVHLEEDTGKSIHTDLAGREVSLVDYNRSGVPLMEIVTEPDLRSPESARSFFSALRQVLMYLGVCDGNLQEGSMRADVNVSLTSAEGLRGTKVEIKNLNSFRAVQHALEYEIGRQAEILDAGDSIPQETRGWLENREITVSQRSKEYAEDYRYFPEPDLPPLRLTSDIVERVRAELPELPEDRVGRFLREYRLPDAAVRVLTEDKQLADFFEATGRAAPGVRPTVVANWTTGDFLRLLNESGSSVSDVPVTPAAFGALISTVDSNRISTPAAKHVLEVMFDTGDDPDAIVERDNLQQIVDVASLDEIVNAVLTSNPNLAETYRGGKTNVLQVLIGKVMQQTKGKANPPLVRQLLEEKLSQPL
jgi:aspartyl-tRNA(Asn)/glutamyl-tRNA(Gln) amidotransferase subunit B